MCRKNYVRRITSVQELDRDGLLSLVRICLAVMEIDPPQEAQSEGDQKKNSGERCNATSHIERSEQEEC